MLHWGSGLHFFFLSCGSAFGAKSGLQYSQASSVQPKHSELCAALTIYMGQASAFNPPHCATIWLVHEEHQLGVTRTPPPSLLAWGLGMRSPFSALPWLNEVSLGTANSLSLCFPFLISLWGTLIWNISLNCIVWLVSLVLSFIVYF